MSRILRTGLLHGLPAGDADEDVVQGGPSDAEAGDAGAFDQRAEDPLRIAAARHAKLLKLAQVADLLDAGETLHAARAAFGRDLDGVVAVLILYGLQRSVEHLAAAEDHEDGIAHGFG